MGNPQVRFNLRRWQGEGRGIGRRGHGLGGWVVWLLHPPPPLRETSTRGEGEGRNRSAGTATPQSWWVLLVCWSAGSGCSPPLLERLRRRGSPPARGRMKRGLRSPSPPLAGAERGESDAFGLARLGSDWFGFAGYVSPSPPSPSPRKRGERENRMRSA
jgi:hypothetical protein